MDYKKFRMNYFLSAFFLLFLILSIPNEIDNYALLFLMLLGLVFFLGSLLLLWQMEIDDNGIIITYLIPLGRNRKLAWDDIHDVKIIIQRYQWKKYYELMIIPVKGKRIKFFRLGVLGYSTLCDVAIKKYREKTSSDRDEKGQVSN